MGVVGAVGVGVLLLECEGYAGAPGCASVAGVCGRRLGRKISLAGIAWEGHVALVFVVGFRNLRMRMLLGGARKTLPVSSLMIAIVLKFRGGSKTRWPKDCAGYEYYSGFVRGVVDLCCR